MFTSKGSDTAKLCGEKEQRVYGAVRLVVKQYHVGHYHINVDRGTNHILSSCNMGGKNSSNNSWKLVNHGKYVVTLLHKLILTRNGNGRAL